MAKASTNTGASHQVPKSSKDMAGSYQQRMPFEGKFPPLSLLLDKEGESLLCLSINMSGPSSFSLQYSNNLEPKNISSFYFFLADAQRAEPKSRSL